MIETFQVESMNGVIDFVRIVNGDTATIMTQENYDKQQAEHFTPMVTDDSKS
jgi:flagellar biosynthesis GTPase FlhF